MYLFYFYLRIVCVSFSQICQESSDMNSLDSTDEPPMKKMKAEAIEEDTSIYTNPIEKDNEEVCTNVYKYVQYLPSFSYLENWLKWLATPRNSVSNQLTIT